MRGMLVLVLTFALGDGVATAQSNAEREDHAQAMCAALVRQAVVSPRSFQRVAARVRPKPAERFFDVVLRFDSANQFNAVIRAEAVCQFNGKDELPYMIELNAERMGLREIEALARLVVEEASAKSN